MSSFEILFLTNTQEKLTSICELSASGSNRKYYRLYCKDTTHIGVEGTSAEENRAFIAMSKHFTKMGLAIPKVFAVSEDELSYIQEDLGDTLLFDFINEGRKTGIFSDNEKEMLQKTMRKLPALQVKGADGFDFSVCYPQAEFNKRSVLWDLNYFKYCFLKSTNVDFQENLLEDDFEKMAEVLLRTNTNTFMYRDFQTRNVMIKDGEPYFIDFQGGRCGPLQYDVASFLWQAKANFDNDMREELLKVYLQSLNKFMPVNELEFREQLRHFVLFRTLQVLGAYGFRGYIERKQHFLESIPFAIENLKQILSTDFSEYPYFVNVLKQMTELEQFNKKKDGRETLLVKVYSFSYRKGIPEDSTGNGGGFVFDCRSINNPGKFRKYMKITGLDEPVKKFLEEDGEITGFLENATNMTDVAVVKYIERGFTDLMICFGCTGGQHRSVYSAQRIAEHISMKFGVDVQLIHREQNIEQKFPRR